MGGIRTVSREEALAALLRRTQHEVAQARRSSSRELPRLIELEDALRAELGLPTLDRTPVAARPAAPKGPTGQARLEALGVPARVVKEWAVAVGLATELKRGRVNPAHVEAYSAAHPRPSARPARPTTRH